MRWGVLANLAVILAVSGLLLFVVFSASLGRSAVDGKIQQAAVFAEVVEAQLLAAPTREKMWDSIRILCRRNTGLKLSLYDASGGLLGGCPSAKLKEARNPDVRLDGRAVTVLSEPWPAALLYGFVVVLDTSKPFPHGVRAIRLVLEIPATVFTPAWKFFGSYLILTQLALFLLGYILFHRTVIGPVREVARLAGKAAGVANPGALTDTLNLGGDIQTISASLRGMLFKIGEDREEMAALIDKLSAVNRDLEAAQQGLIRSEKLAGVGRLAAGLAHEIGNPLQIVMGYTELLARKFDPDSRAEVLSRMDAELRRIHDILSRLLEFASPAPQNIVECDLNELVTDCAALVKGRKGFRNVAFQYSLATDLPLTETEPEKVRQILVNLIFNAADALPASGGAIILRTSRSEESVTIEVQDTGMGIPNENMGKIFDPFFTTKEPGKGTGLGLAVCMGLVESLGGAIQVSSAENEGTLVTVTLPLNRRTRGETVA